MILSFCWYFISCFTGVYINTQKIIITNTLISFCLSLMYPFGYDLIAGVFRISALREQKKDKQCLYITSKVISII